MNKNRMILAVVGGVIGLAVLATAYLTWSSWSAKTAALEGDDENEGLETVVAKAEKLSRSPVYPCAESVKETEASATRLAQRMGSVRMLVAAGGYLIMILASVGQPSPASIQGTVSPDPVIPQWLMGTYLTLTFAELLLSPMGISFVSKVAPPKVKGLMMGLWFAATAVGNYLSSIPGLLWEKVPLWANWALLMGLCLIAAAMMFAMLKKIEAATAE